MLVRCVDSVVSLKFAKLGTESLHARNSIVDVLLIRENVALKGVHFRTMFRYHFSLPSLKMITVAIDGLSQFISLNEKKNFSTIFWSENKNKRKLVFLILISRYLLV